MLIHMLRRQKMWHHLCFSVFVVCFVPLVTRPTAQKGLEAEVGREMGFNLVYDM